MAESLDVVEDERMVELDDDVQHWWDHDEELPWVHDGAAGAVPTWYVDHSAVGRLGHWALCSMNENGKVRWKIKLLSY